MIWNWFKKKKEKKEFKLTPPDIPPPHRLKKEGGMEKEMMEVKESTEPGKEDLKNLFYISMMDYIEEMKQEIQAYKMPEELRKQYETLKKLGFSSSQSIKELITLNDKEKEIATAKEKQQDFLTLVDIIAREFYGRTIIVKEEDFRRIIEDNGLWCGAFSDYTGSIEVENLYEIDKVSRIIDENPYTIKKYHLLRLGKLDLGYSGEVLDKENVERLYRVPFLAVTGNCFISEYDIPGFVNKVAGKKLFEGEYVHIEYEKLKNNLFIAAPIECMKNADKDCKTLYTGEPFICSYCGSGILVHSDWGKNVSEELISKQNELSKLL